MSATIFARTLFLALGLLTLAPPPPPSARGCCGHHLQPGNLGSLQTPTTPRASVSPWRAEVTATALFSTVACQ